MLFEIVNVIEFLKQSRIPENQIAGMKETPMAIFSRCEKRKALPEAFTYIFHNSISGMHNFKHFYSSIHYQHNHQCT